MVDKKTERIICTEFFNGKAHDGTIFKTTLAVLKDILVLADSGYRGIQKVHANSLFPIKRKEDIKNLSESERTDQRIKNKEISSERMKIEHIIGRTKRFNIAKNQYRNGRKNFGLRYNLICGIVNYENVA